MLYCIGRCNLLVHLLDFLVISNVCYLISTILSTNITVRITMTLNAPVSNGLEGKFKLGTTFTDAKQKSQH